MNEQDYQEYLELIKEGNSQRSAAKILGIDRNKIQRFIKKQCEKADLDEFITNLRQGEPCGYFEPKPELKHVARNEFFEFSKEGLSKFGKTISESIEGHVKDQIRNIKKTILIVADTQCKSEENLEYMLWIGHYIAEKQPDVIIHIGDHYDFPSLSSYDKGKASAEGRRLVKDIEAGNTGFEYLNMAMQKHKDYNPRKIFCVGNHEHRLDRYIEDNPELIGTLGVDKLPFAKYGWEVHPFLKPVEVNGIFFVHYLANPMSGKPYNGSAMNILKTVGRSFVVGHKQCLDIAIRPTIDGKQQIGIVNGACYDFNEGYKGYSGNNHFRGLTVLHEAKDGFAVPMFVSLDYMKDKYYS